MPSSVPSNAFAHCEYSVHVHDSQSRPGPNRRSTRRYPTVTAWTFDTEQNLLGFLSRQVGLLFKEKGDFSPEFQRASRPFSCQRITRPAPTGYHAGVLDHSPVEEEHHAIADRDSWMPDRRHDVSGADAELDAAQYRDFTFNAVWSCDGL